MGDAAAEGSRGTGSGGVFVIDLRSRHCLQHYVIVMCEVATSGGVGDSTPLTV